MFEDPLYLLICLLAHCIPSVLSSSFQFENLMPEYLVKPVSLLFDDGTFWSLIL